MGLSLKRANSEEYLDTDWRDVVETINEEPAPPKAEKPSRKSRSKAKEEEKEKDDDFDDDYDED
jgi:hypothetical protein